MPSPLHEAYQRQLKAAIQDNSHNEDFTAELRLHAEAVNILFHLDLGPAVTVLEPCYPYCPRGNRPWHPIIMLRSLMLSVLVGPEAINEWAPRLRSSRVLRLLAGIFDPPGDVKAASPSIGSHYRFMDRIHDGPPLPAGVPGVQPSKQTRRRAKVPKPILQGKSKKKDKKANSAKKGASRRRTKEEKAQEKEALAQNSVNTMKLIDTLTARRDQHAADDLTRRVNQLLLDCGITESARRGLLGDKNDALIVAGDGSSLETAASGLGKRICDCPRRMKCQCDRIYADPDAARGYDSYRRKFIIGYFFYEFCAPAGGHNLPLFVRIDPANTGEHERAAHAREGLYKMFRDDAVGLKMRVMLQDAGHDSLADHLHIRGMDIKPVIPLKGADGDDRVRHPKRPDLQLSPNAIPLCEAGVEMSAWGSGGKDRPEFICPVKAKKLATCPKAPKDDPAWLCQPNTPCSPTVVLNTKDNPRLFPEISRNSTAYHKLYALRTACERSNSQKKQAYRLERCRHRRMAHWLVRIGLAALIQHAAAWLSGTDDREFVETLIQQRAAA